MLKLLLVEIVCAAFSCSSARRLIASLLGTLFLPDVGAIEAIAMLLSIFGAILIAPRRPPRRTLVTMLGAFCWCASGRW